MMPLKINNFNHMKNIIFILIIQFIFQNIYAQSNDKMHCFGDKQLSKDVVADIKKVFEDFEQINGGGKNENFFLIDLVEKKEINEIYIFPTRYIFEIMFKSPDCYFKSNDRIVYMHTEDYIHANDSCWLENILTETHPILGAPNFNVSWSNDSVIEPIRGTGDLNKASPLYHYDPVPFKYIVKNGEIHSKEIVYKLYYPDNRRPKGLPIIRTWPHWNNASNQKLSQ